MSNLILGGPKRCFNPGAFIPPANRTYGNVGRDVLIGPGLLEFDFSLKKGTTLTGKLKLWVRTEFGDIFNSLNFNTPNPIVFASAASPALSTAGMMTSTSTVPRQVQFRLKEI